MKTTDTSAGFQNVASTNHFRIELVEKSVIQKVNMKRTSILRKIIISFFSKLLKWGLRTKTCSFKPKTSSLLRCTGIIFSNLNSNSRSEKPLGISLKSTLFQKLFEWIVLMIWKILQTVGLQPRAFLNHYNIFFSQKIKTNFVTKHNFLVCSSVDFCIAVHVLQFWR